MEWPRSSPKALSGANASSNSWSAAFLAHHPLTNRGWEFLSQEDPEELAHVSSWIRQRKPEAIVSVPIIIEALFRQGWRPPSSSTVILLDWTSNPWGFGGIDQGGEVIAANAVDLVAGQLQHNERGVPENVKMLLFTGRWIPPTKAISP